MLNIVQEENQRLKAELSSLRRVIMQVEPVVMVDGRFEEMILSPITVINIAREIIQNIPQHREFNFPGNSQFLRK
jgi:hypothetical protein